MGRIIYRDPTKNEGTMASASAVKLLWLFDTEKIELEDLKLFEVGQSRSKV